MVDVTVVMMAVVIVVHLHMAKFMLWLFIATHPKVCLSAHG